LIVGTAVADDDDAMYFMNVYVCCVNVTERPKDGIFL